MMQDGSREFWTVEPREMPEGGKEKITFENRGEKSCPRRGEDQGNKYNDYQPESLKGLLSSDGNPGEN